MLRKILLAGLAVFVLGGVLSEVPDFKAGELQSPPFIDPQILNSSFCGGPDGQISRKAAFVKIGYAMAQTNDAAIDQPEISAATLAKLGYDITTNSEKAQAAFNRGLAYMFGFNHGAAIEAFREAQAADPDCAMCYWGEAFARGPNINAPMSEDAIAPAYAAMTKTLSRISNVSRVEQMLVRALAERYVPDAGADRGALDQVFAERMDNVARAFPEDNLVAVIAAEANMDTQAWAYWDATGRMPEGRTARTLELLEGVLERAPTYPPAIHLYIHITEASSNPYRAADFADRLAEQVPELGHLVHMPSHTYFRIGRWEESLTHNVAAVEADTAYLRTHDASPLYEFGYYTHNIHFALTTAMMGGDRETGLAMARLLDEKLPLEMVNAQAWVQPIKAAPYYAMVQFGEPDDILSMARPDDALPFLQGAWHYARGEALARLGRRDEASLEAAALEGLMSADLSALDDGGVPAAGILALSRHTVLARIASGEGDMETAVSHMEAAVALQDSFPYTEPPYWYYPARQTLAAMVLRSGDGDRAEQLFMQTLVESPNNAYAYYGLANAFRAQRDRRAARYANRLYKDAWLGNRRDTPDLERL